MSDIQTVSSTSTQKIVENFLVASNLGQKRSAPHGALPFSYQDGLVTRGESPLVYPIAFLVGAVFKVTVFSEVSTAE